VDPVKLCVNRTLLKKSLIKKISFLFFSLPVCPFFVLKLLFAVFWIRNVYSGYGFEPNNNDLIGLQQDFLRQYVS
jgi:hypothetical protein